MHEVGQGYKPVPQKKPKQRNQQRKPQPQDSDTVVLERPSLMQQPSLSDSVVVEMPPVETIVLRNSEPEEITIACCSLVSLQVIGAEPLPDAGRHWAVVDDHCTITVRATTQPDGEACWGFLNWTGAQARPGGHEAVVSRSAVRQGELVEARLNGPPLDVPVEVVDLRNVTAAPLKVLGAHYWKAYESAAPARLVAVVSPAEDWVRGHVKWSVDARDSATAGEGELDLGWPLLKAADSTPEERNARATLGTVCPKSIDVRVRVCRWPVLQLFEVNFGGYEACNDGVAEIGVAFDRRWEAGRADPVAHQAAAASQSPVCVVRGDTLELSAQFEVVQAPSESETVRIRGRAVHRGVTLDWEQDVVVDPGDQYITFSTIAASATLADMVDASRLTIDWTMSTPGNATPHQACGQSDNLLYVLLGPPHGGVLLYLTLLDMSCTGAAGAQDEDALVQGAFAPLVGKVGDGNGLRRKGDDAELTYYSAGVNTAADNTVWVTHDILGSVAATARCGGWKDMLLHTYLMHGVTSPQSLACVRQTPSGTNNYDLRFLVSQQAFAGLAANAAAAPYRNLGYEIDPDTDIRGQGKDQPQFEFGDHVMVWHNGYIYDASYGLRVAAALMPNGLPDTLAYETAGIGGFGDQKGGCYTLNSTDGTAQSFAERVGKKPVITCTAKQGQTLDRIINAQADRVYPLEPIPAQRRALLRAALQLVHGAAPLAARTQVHIKQPRNQIVLKWTLT